MVSYKGDQPVGGGYRDIEDPSRVVISKQTVTRVNAYRAEACGKHPTLCQDMARPMLNEQIDEM